MKKEPLFFTEKTEIGAQHVPIDSNKFAEGGLIAPNGKPSNLTPTQYKLVRTPEFKAWFGDWENDPENASKVVDSNGEPLIMYHGTDTEFTEFKHQKKGWDTFWFTPRIDMAQMYSNTEKNHPVVFECFLNLRNPHNKYPFDTVKYDGFIDYRVEVDYFTFKKMVTIEVVQVVNSNQIKLADGTNTTFDPNNPDIRFKDGGSINNERIVCENCGWSWKVEDGGDDLYECHKCDHDNTPHSTTKFANGGLIAPNGKPSNLTYEQYKLVRTPEFKAWFGDWENDPENASKVVDENGEPLVVYHGSNETFFEFKNRLFGYRGFYFTDKKSVARSYGSNIRQFFLNSKNFVSEDMKGGSYSDNEWIDDLINNSEMDNKNVHLLNFKDPLDPSSVNRFPESNIFVVFNKSDIKLADGTNTTFDPTNPDIRFDKGGQVNPNSFMKWYIDWYKGISDKMVITMSLPNTIAPFKEKNVVILDVFEKKDQNIDAKPYLKKIVEKADEYGVVIYLEPTPRTDSVIDYYEKFGFELTPNKQFMKRIPHFAGGGGIDINEPFNVNGKTLAERVRILLKQLYPDYKWSVTSSYNKLDVYLLEADFDPFTDKWREEYPTRELYYNVDNRDFEDYNRQYNAKITDRAVEVFKPIREYIDKFVYNRNADDPYADYSDYNVYEYTYIGKWDKPYKQVEPRAGKKKAKAPATPTKEFPFKMGDILVQSTEKLNANTSKRNFIASQEWYIIKKIKEPFTTLLKYSFEDNQLTISQETENIIKEYVKATAPLFKMGDVVVLKNMPTKPKIVQHRAYYQQIGVKYASLEKKFLLSGMYWNYKLEGGTYANEGELELYSPTTSTTKAPKSPQTTSNSTIIENLEVWNEDLGEMTWDEATKKAQELGEGWRLPTKDEFQNILFSNKSKIPNLKDEFYWSSTEFDEDIAWLFSFKKVILYPNYKPTQEYVRAVRDVKQQTTQTANDVFTIQNIVSKTQWSDGLKKTMIEDFVNSGYENVTPLIGKTSNETSNNIIYLVDGFANGKNTYLQANALAEEIHKLIDAGNSPLSPTAPNAENTFIDYLNANTEKANEISKELEVTTSLAMFVMGSKDIANLDSKKYAELMEEFLSKNPKLIEDDSTNAN